MRRPDAPFVEFGFYFVDLDGSAAIRTVFRRLFQIGWRCGENMVLQSGPSVRKGVAFIGDEEAMRLTRVPRDIDVLELLARDDVRVVNIELRPAEPIVPNRYVILAQESVRSVVSHNDHNPIGLWFQGSDIERPHSPFRKKSRQLISRFYQAFRDMVILFEPSYGAINIEYGLPCPAELKLKPETAAFSDSYLSKSFLGERELQSLAAQADGVHLESLERGLMLMSSGLFLPDGPDRAMMLRSNELAYTLKIGGAIARTIKGDRHGPGPATLDNL